MKIEGADKLERRLHAVSDGRRLLGTIQLKAVAEAKKLTVPFRKTGNLGRTIVPGEITSTYALVYAHAAYARYVEEGTGIYGPRRKKIVPRTKPFLAWQVDTTGGGAGGSQLRLSGRSRTRGGESLGGWAFARSVRGRPATPFLRPGAEKAIEGTALKTEIINAWNDAA